MIGESPAFLETQRLIQRIAGCDAPVLIEGETGTGKELAARAIHYAGARKDGPFVPINCGAIPDGLIENELFGHQPGAFTGARKDHMGLVEGSRQGTLFLDEIDALSLKAQVTLLRFLQDQQYRPLGGVQQKHGDVRVIAASNADLTQLAADGGFRLDLLYRVKILYLRLPPLRERQGDVQCLAQHFLQKCARLYARGDKRLHPDTLVWMAQYQWPGNVRELENLIYREYLLTDDPSIRIAALGDTQLERRQKPDRRRSRLMSLAFQPAKQEVIEEFERQYLAQALADAAGNVSAAARKAGKERRALGKLLKKHGLHRQGQELQYSSK